MNRTCTAAALLCWLAFLPGLGGAAGEVGVVRTYARAMDTEAFFRFSEMATDQENTAGRTIVRTSSERGGFYFIVELKQSPQAWPQGAIISAEVLYPDALRARTFEWAQFEAGPRRWLLIGLTGDHDPGTTGPVAWRIAVEDGRGGILAHSESFLWRLHAEAAPTRP